VENILLINNLHKEFAKSEVLHDISLAIPEGEIVGLLGLNGAGKTTLLRCILGLLSPSKGEIKFKGEPITCHDIHRYFGYLAEDFQPPFNLSGWELLNFLKGTLRAPLAVKDCLERAGLLKDKDKRIKEYSRGMVQRLGLALILLKDPEVVLLDEPILGLDLLGQRQAFEIIRELNGKGKTILFSSHLLFHIEKYCHRIGIIHKGTLRFTGRIDEFMDRHKSDDFEEAFLKETNG